MSLEPISPSQHTTPTPQACHEDVFTAFGRSIRRLGSECFDRLKALLEKWVIDITSCFVYLGSTKSIMSCIGIGSSYLDKKREELKKLHPGGVEVDLPNEGANINGFFVKADPSKSNGRVTLLTYGNTEFYEREGPEYLEMLLSRGYSVFTYNTAGFGKSTGQPSPTRCISDEECAFKYLKEQQGYHESDVLIWGRSISTGPAINCAMKHSPGGVFIDGGYSDLPRVCYTLVPILQISFFKEMIERHFNYRCTESLKELMVRNFVMLNRTEDTLMTTFFHHANSNFDAFSQSPHHENLKRSDHIIDWEMNHGRPVWTTPEVVEKVFHTIEANWGHGN